MHKIWFGVALAALIVGPALAQDYHKNFNECAKELGLFFDPSYTHKLQSGAVLRRWYFLNEHQQAAFNDCVARKASLASKPPGKRAPRVSR
jgi:hypothetical protein